MAVDGKAMENEGEFFGGTEDWDDDEIAQAKKEAEEKGAGGDQIGWLEKSRSNGRNRYSVKQGQKGSCTIVHVGAPFRLWEHQFEYGGNFYNFETALKGFLKPGEDDVLKEFNDPYRVWLFVVIDHEPYTTKRGKLIEDRVQFLPVKVQSIDWFQEMKAEYNGDLFGLRCKVIRSGSQTSPAIGDTWISKGKVTRDELVKEFPDHMKVVDELLADNMAVIRKIFAPRSVEELKRLYGGSSYAKNETRPAGKAIADLADDLDDDDVPF